METTSFTKQMKTMPTVPTTTSTIFKSFSQVMGNPSVAQRLLDMKRYAKIAKSAPPFSVLLRSYRPHMEIPHQPLHNEILSHAIVKHSRET
jgi:hypothetical protein